MSHLLDDDDLLHRDRELTLSTGTILALFVGLVLLCGLFFGLGYNLGTHKNRASAVPVVDSTESGSVTPAPNFNAFKPSAGLPSVQPAEKHEAPAPESSKTIAEPSAPAAARADNPATPHRIILPAAPGSFVVQVAAVSHQEDATLLLGALKSRGYGAVARTQPDGLIHIQVGPFATRTDADAMRQRLLNDGYNAIVK